MFGRMYGYKQKKNGDLIRYTPHGCYQLVVDKNGDKRWIKRKTTTNERLANHGINLKKD